VTSDTTSSRLARRRFLAGLGLLTGAAAAPGLMLMHTAGARAPDQPVSDARRWGLLIDASKCAQGCDACVQGCSTEHGLRGHDRPATDAQWIRKLTLTDPASGRASSFPVMCQHCRSAPCVDVCPTGASFRRADGIVLVDKHICIGCRYCMLACPYKARSFIHETLTDQLTHAPRGKGTVESCTLCVHRVDENDAEAVPACAQSCAEAGHGAIMFGDLNDPSSAIATRLREQGATQIRADLGLDTSVRYQNI
jgi:molybdopterin-containing oxidoreductase family iron-sulfur binding subunit